MITGDSSLHPHTLLRHLAFIYYPELIDALSALPAGVIGGSSFFRGHVLRFGEPPRLATRAGWWISADFPASTKTSLAQRLRQHARDRFRLGEAVRVRWSRRSLR